MSFKINKELNVSAVLEESDIWTVLEYEEVPYEESFCYNKRPMSLLIREFSQIITFG